MKKPYYEIRKGLSGNVHYVLVAPNEEIIGSCRGVKTREQLDDMIEQARVCSQDLKNYERKISSNQQPFFNLWNDDRTVLLLKSELYKQNSGRENGIDAMIKYATTDQVIVR